MNSRIETLPMRKSRMAGFTLAELMVVVGILGILAAISYPSYNDYVRKTRRAAGAACALAAAAQLERWYTAKLTYVGGPTSGFTCDPDALKFYSVSASGLTGKAYTVSAAPQGPQSGDSCGTLTINQAGTKSPSTAGCW